MGVQFSPYDTPSSTTMRVPRRRRPHEQCAFKTDTESTEAEIDRDHTLPSESDHDDATIVFESSEDAALAERRERSGLFFCYGELCEVRVTSEVQEPHRKESEPAPPHANNATVPAPQNVSGSTWLYRLAMLTTLVFVYGASSSFVWLLRWFLEWVVYFGKQLFFGQINAALSNWIRPRAEAWLTTFFLPTSDPAEVADADEVEEEPVRSDDDETWARLCAVYEWWTFHGQVVNGCSNADAPADASANDYEVDLPSGNLRECELFGSTDERAALNATPRTSTATSEISSMPVSDTSALR